MSAAVADPPKPLSDAELADGWISLFDGQTLFGWKPASKADWQVKDGAIFVSGGERGLLKHAVDNPQVMSAEIAEVMEPPFPSVAAGDPVREAVELLSGEGQAITVADNGRSVGILTRADLLESLAS